MTTWERVVPSGAWKVWDSRLRNTPYGLSHMQYIGYTKREAMSLHARYLRENGALR